MQPGSETLTCATQLNNGLQVITAVLPHMHSTTVALAIGCGSRHEAPEQWGLTHLLEHMLFRGSASYPSARALALAFEQAGGTLEAETWRDHTYLSVTTHPTGLAHVLAALADMVIAPRFQDLGVERQIVETELQAELDERGRDIDLGNISRAQVWPNSPMGRRILGCRKSLRRFDITDLADQHRCFYGAKNAVLAVAGPVDPDTITRLATRCFGAMPPGRTVLCPTPALFVPRERLSVRPHVGAQIALQLTFDALPDGHPEFFAQTLLINILDDGMTSRLQQALCERRGLVYTLATGLDCYNDCGLYDIEMHVAPRRADRAVAAVLQTLQSVLDGGVTTDELNLARKRGLQALEFRADCPAEVARHLAVGALFKAKTCSLNEAQRLNAVTKQDIAGVAVRLFAGTAPHVTLIGPTHRANLTRIAERLARFPKH